MESLAKQPSEDEYVSSESALSVEDKEPPVTKHDSTAAEASSFTEEEMTSLTNDASKTDEASVMRNEDVRKFVFMNIEEHKAAITKCSVYSN